MKLREMFNKASEGKSKLSVNDFSKNHFLVARLAHQEGKRG
jgi:hypothetical protein